MKSNGFLGSLLNPSRHKFNLRGFPSVSIDGNKIQTNIKDKELILDNNIYDQALTIADIRVLISNSLYSHYKEIDRRHIIWY